MESDAQAALSAAFQSIGERLSCTKTNRANRQRAEDFIARASEFDARVYLSTAPKRMGADSVLLWFSTQPGRAAALISLSGAIDAEIAAIRAGIAVYNAHVRLPTSGRSLL
jgi:hypothetical protein